MMAAEESIRCILAKRAPSKESLTLLRSFWELVEAKTRKIIGRSSAEPIAKVSFLRKNSDFHAILLRILSGHGTLRGRLEKQISFVTSKRS